MKHRLASLSIIAVALAVVLGANYFVASAETVAVQPGAVPSLAPADAPTTMPYPAYGTPVPGVREGVATPGVPRILPLSNAINIAVALSPALASARADIGVSAAEVRLARAGLLPSIGAQVNSSHDWFQNRTGNTGNLNAGVNGAAVGKSIQSNSGGLSLSQLIFDGGRTAAGIRAAKATETESADTYRRALQTVAYQVANAYYSALAAERTTQVDAELVRENAVQLALVQAQYRVGTAARVDVITAEQPVAQARVAVVQAQGNEVAAQAAFANALGLNADAEVRPKDDTPFLQASGMRTIPLPTYAVAVTRARESRPDLTAGLDGVHSAEESLRRAKLGLFPTLSANAAQNESSNAIGGSNYGGTTSVGASLSLPLFDQGQTSANVARAKAEVDAANAAYQTTLLNLQLNVRQTLAQLVSQREAVNESQVALNEAQEVLKATQAQYRAGVTTLPQLLAAQVGLSQALVTQVSAVYSLRQAEQAYLYAIGGNGS
jgi:outer membrane protein